MLTSLQSRKFSTMKFNSLQILKLFRHLAGKEIDDVAISVAIFEVFTGDRKPINDLDGAECYGLSAVMNALLDGSAIPDDSGFSDEEISAISEAFNEFSSEQDDPGQAVQQPNGNPAVSETLSDEEVQLLVRATEFVPPNLGTFKRLARRSQLIEARLATPNGEGKLAEVAAVLQSIRSGTANPTLSHLDGNEEAAIRAAREALNQEGNSSRMSAEYVLRLQQLLLKGAKPETVRETLLVEFPEAATQALLLTGSFEGLIRVIAPIATGKGEVLKGAVAELRDCEIEQLRTAFGKPAQPPVPLTPEILNIVAQAIETEQEPGGYSETRGVEKRKLHNIVAAIRTFTKAGEERVGAASRYGLTNDELEMVLQVMRDRKPVQDQHLTRDQFVALFKQYQMEEDFKLPHAILPKEAKGATLMIRDNLRSGGGWLKTARCYDLEQDRYNQFFRWLEELARSEKLLYPRKKPAPGRFYQLCNHPRIKPHLTWITWLLILVALRVFYLWAKNWW